jgi:hypothetical protein
VIADEIPSYEEFNKFVLFSDWEINLRKYALNPLLRRQHLKKGKDYILSNESLLAQIHEIRAKDLICFCAPLQCHGDVLIELANQ